MNDSEELLTKFKLAEQQFRLACTVNLAVANSIQTLDVPVEWTFGTHRVSYKDFGLREDQADYAAFCLELTATFVLVGAIRDIIVGSFENPKKHSNKDIVAAYQISRLIRNAFAHSMMHPCWSIDKDCQNKTFCIENIITLDTSKIHKEDGRFQEERTYQRRNDPPESKG